MQNQKKKKKKKKKKKEEINISTMKTHQQVAVSNLYQSVISNSKLAK